MTGLLSFVKGNWFFLGLIVVILLGTLYPELGIQLKPWINSMVAVSMFLIGFRFESSELSFSKKNLKAVLLCLCCGFVVMPVFSYLLGRLFFADDLEMFVGVVLAGTVPTTQASSVIWTDISGGNHSLALILMTVINLVGVFLSPLLLSIGLGGAITVPVWPMLRTLIFFILVPVFVGVFVRRRVKEISPTVKGGSRILSIMLIWATVLTALSSGNILELPLLKVIACVSVQYGAMALVSYWGARAIGLAKRDAIAVMFCSAQVTITFAAVVGFTYFTSRSIIYVVVYHLFQQFMGQLTAKRMIMSESTL